MAAKKKVVRRVKKQPKTKSSKGLTPHQAIVEVLQKKYGKTTVTTLQNEKQAVAQIKEFIPTGIATLDNYVIGRGGFPIGRISETFGEEGCGKTALMYRTLGMCQRIGGVSALIDAEFAFDEERAAVHGIDQDALIIEYPRYLEECLDIVKDTAKAHDPKKGPLFITLDSIASLKTKDGAALDAGESGYRGEAKLFSDELRDLPRILTAHRAHLAMVNQVRHKMNVRFGSNITTPGGNAPKFYSSVRLQFFGGKAIKNKFDEHLGKDVTIMAIKNRLQSPFKKAKIRLDFMHGYNDMWSTVEHAKRMSLIKPRKVDGKTEPLIEQYMDALEELGWDFNEAYSDHNRQVATLADGLDEVDSDDTPAVETEDDEDE